MLSTNPYFNFMGNTEEAMNFYKSVFGGEFTSFNRFKDIPGGDKMPLDEQEKIVHVTLTTPNGLLFMATDALQSMEQTLTFGNNYHIILQMESEAETEKIFQGLSAGGKVEMPLNKTFWGAYCGMCRDKFGVQWMLNFTYPQKQK